MTATVLGNYAGGLSFRISQDGHSFLLDGPREHGGSDAGPRPKNLLLSALVGCTGMDVVSILRKMKVTEFGLEIEATAQSSDDYPVHFTSIELVYRFRGRGLPRKKVERAVELSQNRYCGVSHMLSRAAELRYSIEYSPPVEDR